MKHFESFESNRWIWRINLFLQVILIFALFGIVNYIGMNVYVRHDLTRNRAFSLSPETISYIRELTEPVNFYVTIAPDEQDENIDQAYRDVRGILREFEYVSRENPTGHIRVEMLNVYAQRVRAESLGIDQPNVVILESGGLKIPVFLDELYNTKNLERSQFQGEKVFTSRLLDVTSREKPVLYFLQGHGEMRLADVDPLRGISQLAASLQGRNYNTYELDLSSTRRVPEDADMVIILSPQSPILQAEQEILREYLNAGNGRVLIGVDPAREHGLEDLFFDWGILVDDVVAIETDPNFRDPAGDLRVRRMAPHPITQVLIDNQLPVLMGFARSVRADPGRPLDDSLEVVELMATSESSFGESNYSQAGRPAFDPSRDLRGPIKLATVAERKVDSQLGVNLPGGRVIAFGNTDFIANHRIVQSTGNFTLFLNSVSWALARDNRLNIPARPVERLQLTLSQEQLAWARISILAGPSLIVALIGSIVYLSRRR